jgi:hypothetical protein
MRWLIVFLLIMPAVIAVKVPLTLEIVANVSFNSPEHLLVNESLASHPSAQHALDSPTGAVVYDRNAQGKTVAVGLFLVVVGILAAVLVWRR